MKKILLSLVCIMLCISLVGCGNQNASISANINGKLDKLESTINSIHFATAEELALTSTSGGIVPTGLFGQGAVPNINSYGNYYGGMFGMNPYAGFGAYMPYYPYGAFSAPMYGGGAFNNTMFNTIGAGAVNPSYRNITNGIFPSNIDTYRISSITKDGKTTTTINTYKDGKEVESRTEETVAPITNTRMQNLSAVCNSCIASSDYSQSLKNNVLAGIKSVRKSAAQIKNKGIKLSNEQKSAVNEYLDAIARTTNKLNMNKGEYNTELKNVRSSKARYTLAPANLGARYTKLMSCIDARNVQLQSALNSLVGLDNCIHNQTQSSFWGVVNGSQGSTNKNCETCEDCQNCETCKDCKTCEDCKNWATTNDDTANSESENNSSSSAENNDKSEDLSNNNVSPNAPSTAEIPVTDDKTSDSEIAISDDKTSHGVIETNHFEPNLDGHRPNIEQTRTESDNIIEDNFVEPAKDIADGIEKGVDSLRKVGMPKEYPPVHEADIIKNVDENPEFLAERDEDKRLVHNKYEDEVLARKEQRLERIREHQKRILERRQADNQNATTNDTAPSRASHTANSDSKSGFRVEKEPRITYGDSISNENEHENNKSLTA